MKQKKSVQRKRMNRRRIPAALVAAFTVTVSTLAILHQGVTTAEVDVDDGGIWVTNSSKKLVGHLNYDSRILDGAFRANTTEFDIGQSGNDVTFTDKTAHSVAPVDVAQVSLGAATSLPENARVVQGGSRLAVMDASGGQVWLSQVSSPSSTAYTDEGAVATDMDQGVATVSQKGTLFAISPRAGRRISVTREGQLDRLKSTDIKGLSANAELVITAVGEQPVALDTRNRVLVLPDGSLRNLADDGISASVTLQDVGPDSSSVLLATDRELISVPLKGGAVTKIPASSDGSSGTPARPVFHKGCAYGAWAKSGAYVRNCTDPSLNSQMIVDSLKKATTIVFRTNRTRIVLNDTTSGSVWLPEHNMVLMDDWDKQDPNLDKKEKEEDSPQITDQIADPQRQDHNTPPDAVDDEFGIRPGRTTTLPVLNNDSDADGDVLTARPVTDPQFGKVTRTRGGRALQITDISDTQTGSTSFTYEASDGQAVATAKVTVTVHPWDMNSGPKQLRDPGIALGHRAQIEYNVLTDWQDPDGDPIFLSNARAPEGIELQFREEGTLQIRDLGASVGVHTIALEVSDGRATTSGTLTVNVQNPGNLPPVANADFYVARAGEITTISPLANDTDPNGDNLSLVALSVAPAGSQITPDLELGTVNFVAQAPGSYQFTYTVSDGPATALGVVRVDVVQVDEQAVPVAEDDLAVLPAGGSALVAPLNNDSDPAGGVLVVQQVEVPDGLGLEVTLVDRHLLRITAPAGLDSSVSFDYVVSNGTNTARARVTVVPTTAEDTKLPPELQPDRTRVRVGDIASVPVLANDRSPSGLTLKVDPSLQYTPNEAVGTPFVTGNLVRLEAGNTPGVMHVAYTVRDSAGNMATSTVTFEVLEKNGTNAQPQPKALTAWAVSGETTRISVPLNGIDPDGDSVTLVGIEQSPTKGTVELGVDWLEYTPAPNTTGTDVFTYIVEDRQGKQASARVRVGIAPPATLNQPPTAVPDTVLTRPNRQLGVAVLTNDIDPDGDTISLVPGSLQTTTEELKPEIHGNSIFLTTPAADGSYLVSYQVTDNRGGVSRGTLTINVASDAQLQPPIARDDVVSASQLPAKGGTVKVSVLANDEDPDGDVNNLRVTTKAEGVEVSGSDLVITPKEERMLIVYTITDADGLSSSAVVSVPGLERNHPAIDTTKVPIKVRAGEDVSLDIADYVIVRDGRSPRITNAATLRPSAGIDEGMTLSDDRHVHFHVNSEWSGKSSFSFEVSDGAAGDDSALTSTLTLPLKVEATQNQPVSFVPTGVRVAAGEEATAVDLAQMVRDPEGADPAGFKYEISNLPEGVAISLDGHTLLVRADVDRAKGPVGMVTVSVDDGAGAVSGQLPITVVASTRPLIQVSDALLETARSGGLEVVDLTRYTINPFPGTPIRVVGASIQIGEGTVDPQGTNLNITPAVGFRGQMTVRYRLMDATGDPDRIVEGKVRLVVRDRPDAPTNVSVTATGPGSALVTFQAGSDNGATITGFTATDRATGRSYSCESGSCQLSGLENGVRHSFTVVAHNAVGTSDPSAASAEVLIDMRPEAPLPPTVEPENGAIIVRWRPPTNQGSAIKSYTLYVYENGGARQIEVPGNVTEYRVDGLRNGQTYSVAISARNGAEEPSPTSQNSQKVVPFGPPERTDGIRVENLGGSGDRGRVRFTWPTPNANGAEITRYTIEVNGRSVGEVGGDKNEYTAELATGENYHVKIRAYNWRDQSSDSSEVAFQVYTSPLNPNVSSFSSTATGEHGMTKVSGLAVAPGQGFNNRNLHLEWSRSSGGNGQWNSVTSGETINVGADGDIQIFIRQVGNVNGQDVPGNAVPVTVKANSKPAPPTYSMVLNGTSVVVSWDATPPAGYLAPDEVILWYKDSSGPASPTQGKVLQGSATLNPSGGQVLEVSVGSQNSLGTTWGRLSGTNIETAKINIPGTFSGSTSQCTAANARGAELAECQMVSITLPSTWASDAVPLRCSMWDDFSQSYATFTPRGGPNSTFETGVRLSKANSGNLPILLSRVTCAVAR